MMKKLTEDPAEMFASRFSFLPKFSSRVVLPASMFCATRLFSECVCRDSWDENASNDDENEGAATRRRSSLPRRVPRIVFPLHGAG